MPDEPGPESWGEQVYPRFYVERGDGWSPSTLSLWRDLTALMAFSYGGIHAEAMRHGREWFVKPTWPGYALWWVARDHTPDWAEGVKRLEFLHDNGPSPFAFDFKTPFDADGNPISIDREMVKRSMRLKSGAAIHVIAEAGGPMDPPIVEHDLFRKPVTTLRGHALGSIRSQRLP